MDRDVVMNMISAAAIAMYLLFMWVPFVVPLDDGEHLSPDPYVLLPIEMEWDAYHDKCDDAYGSDGCQCA